VSLQVQFWTLAMMMLCGIGMGAAFDAYRVVANQLRFGRIWIPVLDLLYWLAATLTVFRVLTFSNEGEVRAYVFIGLLLGVSIYFWLFSVPFITIVGWLISAAYAVVRFLLRCVDLFVVFPLRMLYRTVRLFLGFLIVFSMFLFRFVVQLIRPFWLFFRWLLSPVSRRLSGWIMPRIRQWRIQEWTRHTIDMLRGKWKSWFRR
jgi:spore cortex biosynthesis protein YabQ